MRYFIFSFLLLSAAANCVFAQWQVEWEQDTPLDSICGGSSNPIPDGIEVRIYHDADNDGVDDTDPLLTICDDPPNCLTGPAGTANYNTFTVNGSDPDLGIPGGFLSSWYWGYLTAVIQSPSPNRIYIRVCVHDSLHYVSPVYQPTSGAPLTYYDPMTTCLNTGCPGCDSPPTPTNLRASDSTSCASITLQWNYPDSASISGSPVDRMYIYRDGALIDSQSVRDTNYVDNGVTQSGTAPYIFNYYVKARRNCSGSYAYAQSTPNQGSLYPNPPAVTMQRASDDTCGYVRVRWTYNISAGLDSFIIKRNGTRVGAVLGSPLGNRVWDYVTSDTIRAGYSVVAWNRVCLEGTPSAVDSGQAKQIPSTPTNMNATQGNCLVTTISWDPVPNATAYKVYRNTAAACTGTQSLLATVNAPTVTCLDTTASNWTVFGYKVSALNLCGESALSACFSGYRVGFLGAVTGVNASDGTSCDTVTVTWNNLANESGYKVYRTPTSGGTTDTLSATVPVDCTRFWDQTAVAGTLYNYGVRAFNACGNGTASAVNSGYRKLIPAQVAGVVATDSTQCWGVQVTWSNLAGEDSFIVKRDGNRIGYRLTDQLAYDDSTAVASTIYNYTVTAKNACGIGIESIANSGSRAHNLQQVTGVSATDGICFETYISWIRSAGVDSFVVYRNGSRVGSVFGIDSSFSDATGQAGVRYDYTVTAYNACGPGIPSLPDSGWQLTSPARPAGVVATQNYCDRVVLTWQDVSFESSYIIRRNNSIIAFIAGDSISFTDYPPTGSYSYTVQAINECGASQTSTPATGIRAGPPSIALLSAVEDCPDIVLSFTHSANSDWVRVFRDGAILDSVPCPSSQYRDTGATAGVHSYFVQAVNECGFFLSDTLYAEVVQMPQPPDSLAFTDNHCDRITLTWDTSAGVFSHYQIYRDGGVYANISSSVTTYTDTNAICGEEYRYQLSAVSDTCGESDLTEEVLAALTDCPPPSSPAIVLSIIGENANLRWNHIASSDSGCPLTVTGYLVFYAPTAGGPFYYHGFTTDTTYMHVRVAHYNLGMFYQVTSTTEPLSFVQQLKPDVTREETMRRLRESSRSR
jgi:hypothetical protein